MTEVSATASRMAASQYPSRDGRPDGFPTLISGAPVSIIVHFPSGGQEIAPETTQKTDCTHTTLAKAVQLTTYLTSSGYVFRTVCYAESRDPAGIETTVTTAPIDA
jgi:hypothetical protein